jgi:isopentenyl phosphate kinase
MEGDTMTAKEIIEIISNSSLWKTLSLKERAEAATYAMKISGINHENEDVSELIGEVYSS